MEDRAPVVSSAVSEQAVLQQPLSRESAASKCTLCSRGVFYDARVAEVSLRGDSLQIQPLSVIGFQALWHRIIGVTPYSVSSVVNTILHHKQIQRGMND